MGEKNEADADEAAKFMSKMETKAPHYRFDPTDEELILYYLRPKIDGIPNPYYNKMHEVYVYTYNPKSLTEKYSATRENKWYFLSPRERKYRNGIRPNRAAIGGFWRASTADKPVFQGKGKDTVVGYRRLLCFHEGTPTENTKSAWNMHEFSLHVTPKPNPKSKRKGKRKISEDDENSTSMMFDSFVLCKIYKSDRRKEEEEEEEEEEAKAEAEEEEEEKQRVEVVEADIYDTLPPLMSWGPNFSQQEETMMNTPIFDDHMDLQFHFPLPPL